MPANANSQRNISQFEPTSGLAWGAPLTEILLSETIARLMMAITIESDEARSTRSSRDAEQSAAPAPADPKLFIIAGRCGRMANRLVLFANFIALAEEQGHRLINPTFHSYAELFQATSRDIYCQYPITNRKSLFDIVPGAACAIRSTRIFFHAAHAAG